MKRDFCASEMISTLLNTKDSEDCSWVQCNAFQAHSIFFNLNRVDSTHDFRLKRKIFDCEKKMDEKRVHMKYERESAVGILAQRLLNENRNCNHNIFPARDLWFSVENYLNFSNTIAESVRAVVIFNRNPKQWLFPSSSSKYIKIRRR